MTLKRTGKALGGFTMLELLVVISIMAIIATLAIGAATKSVKQGRNKKIDVMTKGLEIALQNYRAQMGAWPFNIADMEQNKDDNNVYWAHGSKNYVVFRNLYSGGSGPSKTVYLDSSAFMTQVSGKRMSLRAALESGKSTAAPLGYPFAANQNRFCFFCVEYRTLTDTVKIHRQDMRNAPYKPENRTDGDHTCPDGDWGKAD